MISDRDMEILSWLCGDVTYKIPKGHVVYF